MRLPIREEVDLCLKKVRLEDINWEDDFFRISSPSVLNFEKIVASIKTIGVINQPFVIPQKGKLSIVCGFKRFLACRQLKQDAIYAKQIDPRTPVEACAKIAIADNSFQRPLNLIEQSRSYALLDSTANDKKAFQKAITETGLSNNPSWISKIIPLCRLPLPIQTAVEGEFISIAIVQLLSHMDQDVAVFLCDLFIKLTLGLNKQREIIQLASEIAKRDGITLREIFQEEKIQAVIEDNQLDKNKKASMIRQWLKFKRYPCLSQKLDTFDYKIRELKLGNQVKLTPPAYFEGKQYKLNLDFSRLEDLANFRETIKRLEEDEYLRSLIGK